MSAEWICDGCGRRAPARIGSMGDLHKPSEWYERNQYENDDAPFGAPKGGIKAVLSACSRDCITRAAGKHGGHDLVLPV